MGHAEVAALLQKSADEAQAKQIAQERFADGAPTAMQNRVYQRTKSKPAF